MYFVKKMDASLLCSRDLLIQGSLRQGQTAKSKRPALDPADGIEKCLFKRLLAICKKHFAFKSAKLLRADLVGYGDGWTKHVACGHRSDHWSIVWEA